MDVHVRGSEGVLHSLQVEPSLCLGDFRLKLQELGLVKGKEEGVKAGFGSYRLLVVPNGSEREPFPSGAGAGDSKTFRLGGEEEQDTWSLQKCGVKELDTILVLPKRTYPSFFSARVKVDAAAKGTDGSPTMDPAAGPASTVGDPSDPVAPPAAQAQPSFASAATSDVKMEEQGEGGSTPSMVVAAFQSKGTSDVTAQGNPDVSEAVDGYTSGVPAEFGAMDWKPPVTAEQIYEAISAECARRGMPFPSSAASSRQARQHAQSQVSALAAILAMAGQPGLVEAAMAEVVPDPALVQQLQDMGFGASSARRALALNRNVVEAAVEWLLSNGQQDEDDDEDEEEEVDEDDDGDDEREEGDEDVPDGAAQAHGRHARVVSLGGATRDGSNQDSGGSAGASQGGAVGSITNGESEHMDVEGSAAEGMDDDVHEGDGGSHAPRDPRSRGVGGIIGSQSEAHMAGAEGEGPERSASARGEPGDIQESQLPSFLGRGVRGRPMAPSRAEAVAALEAVLRAGEDEGLAEEEDMESLMLEQLHAELEAAAGGAAGARGDGDGAGRLGPQAAALAAAAAAAGLGPGAGRDAPTAADLELMLREVSRMFQQESGVLERFLAELRAAQRNPPGQP